MATIPKSIRAYADKKRLIRIQEIVGLVALALMQKDADISLEVSYDNTFPPFGTEPPQDFRRSPSALTLIVRPSKIAKKPSRKR